MNNLREIIVEVSKKNTKLAPREPLFKERFPDWESSNFTIDVSCRQAPLFRFDNKESKFLLICDESSRQDMIEVMDKSGVFDLEFTFYPNKAGIVLEHEKIVKNSSATRQGIDARKSTRDAGWVPWFNDIFRLLAEEVHVIPDTNVLMRHYYSNYLSHLRSHTYPNLQVFFKISRLSIIEIENRYNREGKNSDRDRRIAFHTAKEILALQREPNSTLPEADIDLLTSFGTAVGKKFADAWVRKEVTSYVRHLRENRGQEDKFKAVVFVTCDLMNALAASAEGLNTLYISRLSQMSDTLADGNALDAYSTLAKLLLCTAIQFGECDCVIKAKKSARELTLAGMWPGKNISDWISDTVIQTKV